MPATLIRFHARQSAYRFVSELRRRYDLDRLASLRVQATTGDEVVVEMPSQEFSAEVADVAERHGGREPIDPTEVAQLRAAVTTARERLRRR